MTPKVLRNLIVMAAARLSNTAISNGPVPAAATAELWNDIAQAEAELAEMTKPIPGPGSETREDPDPVAAPTP